MGAEAVPETPAFQRLWDTIEARSIRAAHMVDEEWTPAADANDFTVHEVPEFVMRQTDRDFEILRLHRPQRFTGWDAENFGSQLWCGRCRDNAPWPCRDVLALARAYSVTLAEEEVPQ
jgi:hypothetical protein